MISLARIQDLSHTCKQESSCSYPAWYMYMPQDFLQKPAGPFTALATYCHTATRLFLQLQEAKLLAVQALYLLCCTWTCMGTWVGCRQIEDYLRISTDISQHSFEYPPSITFPSHFKICWTCRSTYTGELRERMQALRICKACRDTTPTQFCISH